MSQNRPTRIYDERLNPPVSGDCALVDGPSSEGDRTVDCSTYVRTDLIMHRVLTRQSPLRMRIEASARALVVTVLRGRSAATPALDNGGLLIEVQVSLYPDSQYPPVPRRPPKTFSLDRDDEMDGAIIAIYCLCEE